MDEPVSVWNKNSEHGLGMSQRTDSSYCGKPKWSDVCRISDAGCSWQGGLPALQTLVFINEEIDTWDCGGHLGLCVVQEFSCSAGRIWNWRLGTRSKLSTAAPTVHFYLTKHTIHGSGAPTRTPMAFSETGSRRAGASTMLATARCGRHATHSTGDHVSVSSGSAPGRLTPPVVALALRIRPGKTTALYLSNPSAFSLIVPLQSFPQTIRACLIL